MDSDFILLMAILGVAAGSIWIFVEDAIVEWRKRRGYRRQRAFREHLDRQMAADGFTAYDAELGVYYNPETRVRRSG